MSACQFSVNFKGTAQEIYLKTKNAVEGQGGIFEGDENGGTFSVSLMSNTIAGSYKVEGNELQLVIDSKPMFLPCNAIQGFLSSKLS
jgi:hypothetical protein